MPTCPDYEFWARLGFRFPPSAFKRYDVSVAQAYRTRDSMSFRAESFTQFCRDKLTHLNNLLAKGYAGIDVERCGDEIRAGIHMWAAEQLSASSRGMRTSWRIVRKPLGTTNPTSVSRVHRDR